MRKARPVRLACPALMLLRAGSVFTTLVPLSVATRHLPPQAGGGAWCPLFLPLGGVSSVPLKNAKSRLTPAWWLKFILRRHSIYTAWALLLLLGRISGGREGNGVAVMACFGAAQ